LPSHPTLFNSLIKIEGFAPKLRPSFCYREERFEVDCSGGRGMPYKDPEQKREWERLHRSERLARRRELRQAEAAREEAQPVPQRLQGGASGLLLPLAAGSALAVYNPKLAIGAGGLTLLLAAVYKKDWSWWILGVSILVIGLFFQWNQKTEKE
jgi:hypothetical protein